MYQSINCNFFFPPFITILQFIICFILSNSISINNICYRKRTNIAENGITLLTANYWKHKSIHSVSSSYFYLYLRQKIRM